MTLKDQTTANGARSSIRKLWCLALTLAIASVYFTVATPASADPGTYSCCDYEGAGGTCEVLKALNACPGGDGDCGNEGHCCKQKCNDPSMEG